MVERLRVLVVSGSRADWGFLSEPVSLMRQDGFFEVSVVATGQHLSAASGGSLEELTRDAGPVAAEVRIRAGTAHARDIVAATSEALAGFGQVLADRRPDLMLLIGDRFEMFAAAAAGSLSRVPMAHLAGGDVSYGAVDDALRHAITKLSHIHFPTNPEAAGRIVRMGEQPDRVHCVGSTGLDRLLKVQPMAREAFFSSIGHVPRKKNVLVTMHPVTLDRDPLADARVLLAALAEVSTDIGLIMTGSNMDEGAREIDSMLQAFAAAHVNATYRQSLGSLLYVNALAHVDAVAGNSSSGLYEAPSFGIPTLNVGGRQAGRLRPESVVDVAADKAEIIEGLSGVLAMDCRNVGNPYGDGKASERVVGILRQIEKPSILLKKEFYGGGQ